MPYIYKITNKINNKVYIGKTGSTIEKRWQEHCKDSVRREEESRPLYSAMNKYGIHNFFIEQLEEVVTDEEACEREIYWIEFYGSFKHGYNATKGGDGRAYADYDLIYALWNEGKNNKEIQKILNYDSFTIKKALEQQGVTAEERQRKGRIVCSKTVAKLDKNTKEIIAVYSSIRQAYDDLGKEHSGHIAAVCNGKRKTAYGFSWKYI